MGLTVVLPLLFVLVYQCTSTGGYETHKSCSAACQAMQLPSANSKGVISCYECHGALASRTLSCKQARTSACYHHTALHSSSDFSTTVMQAARRHFYSKHTLTGLAHSQNHTLACSSDASVAAAAPSAAAAAAEGNITGAGSSSSSSQHWPTQP
jgi:hypothetical protein